MLEGIPPFLLVLCFSIVAVVILVFLAEMLRPVLENVKTSNLLFELIPVIDHSLTRYKDREFTHDDRSATWRCHSKLFSFVISMSQELRGCTIVINCQIDNPFEFTWNHTRGIDVKGDDYEAIETLLRKNEMQSIRNALVFFNFIESNRRNLNARAEGIRHLKFSRWSRALSALLTLARLLHQMGSKLLQEAAGSTACPYCKEKIHSESIVIQCKACHTLHHQECWNENGRCSVFGCNARKSKSLRL